VVHRLCRGHTRRLNPRTGEIKEWANPLVKAGIAGGFHDIQLDSEGNPWLGRHDSTVCEVGQKDSDLSELELAAVVANQNVRTNFLATTASGKVWVKDNTDTRQFLFDPVTRSFKGYDKFPRG